MESIQTGGYSYVVIIGRTQPMRLDQRSSRTNRQRNDGYPHTRQGVRVTYHFMTEGRTGQLENATG